MQKTNRFGIYRSGSHVKVINEEVKDGVSYICCFTVIRNPEEQFTEKDINKLKESSNIHLKDCKYDLKTSNKELRDVYIEKQISDWEPIVEFK